MKILLTGAHFTPAVAVAKELMLEKDMQIVYVGRNVTREDDKSLSVESQVLPNIGVRFINITTGRLRRDFSIFTLISLIKIPIGFIQSIAILLQEKPDIILSFGGYVAVPIVIVGWLLSIPIIIHEQTLVSGLANKISSIFADRIAVSFNNKLIEGKTILTGNPLREQILNPEKYSLGKQYTQLFDLAQKEHKPVVLVTGGNQGSHIINQTIEKVLEKLKKKVFLIHVTGDSKYQDYERLKSLEDSHYLVTKWIGDEVGVILSKIDFAICRGGINTLSELAYFKKPAIVVPISFIYKNEQWENAKFFEKIGLVKTLPQSQLNGESLEAAIDSMLHSIKRLDIKDKDLKQAIIPGAAQRLALETLLLKA